MKQGTILERLRGLFTPAANGDDSAVLTASQQQAVAAINDDIEYGRAAEAIEKLRKLTQKNQVAVLSVPGAVVWLSENGQAEAINEIKKSWDMTKVNAPGIILRSLRVWQ